MKKLLMFAAVAAMGVSAFAACGEAPEVQPVNCAAVYDFKASLKTTKAKAATIKVECEDPEGVCYREKASMSIKGYYYSCECDCDFKDGYSLVFWDNIDKEIVDADYEWDWVDRISKKANGVEALGAISWEGETCAGELVIAGFGKFDVKNDRVANISGYAVGFVNAPLCAVKCEDGEASIAWDLCDATSEGDSGDSTIAYGTWAVKYNKSASKKVAAVGPTALKF